MEIFYLHKSMDGNVYLQNHNVAYDIARLSKEYPDKFFVIVNDSGDYPYNNVFSKSQILEAAHVASNLTIQCSCGYSNRYTKSCCDKCGRVVEYHNILCKVLGNDYRKAVVTLQVDNFLDSVKPVKDHNTFESYATTANDDDPFIKAITSHHN